jgi:hypothetical protein
MARPTIQSSKFDFTVIQEPWIRNGVNTGVFGNFRTDTGACLGTATERYGIVQNSDLEAAAHKALALRGLTPSEHRVIVTGDGERFYSEFSFRDKSLATQVGDLFGYRLTLKNSFDCSMRAAIELGFERLICKNGAATLEREFSLARLHFAGISADFIADAVDKALARGGDALAVYNEMARVAISDEQGVNILNQLVQAGALSGVIKQSVETLWLAPRRNEDKARNLYNLYNAATEHLTHNVKGSRFEYAEKTSNGLLMRLVNAARNPAKLAKLVVPVPSDAQVTVTVDAGSVGAVADAGVIEAEIVG